MRQFLYLDTDIVNSIVAQQSKGLRKGKIETNDIWEKYYDKLLEEHDYTNENRIQYFMDCLSSTLTFSYEGTNKIIFEKMAGRSGNRRSSGYSRYVELYNEYLDKMDNTDD